MKLLFKRAALLSLLCGLCVCRNAPAQPRKELPLTTTLAPRFQHFKSSVIVDERQGKNDKGLALLLVVENDSSQAVTISNPIDLLALHLVNEQGVDVMFQQLSKVGLCTKGRKPTIYHSYVIGAVALNGAPLTLNLWDEKQVALPAHSRLTIALTIADIWKATGSRREPGSPVPLPPYEPSSPEMVMPIPAGKYRLRASLGIALAARRGIDFLRMQPVMIEYVEKLH